MERGLRVTAGRVSRGVEPVLRSVHRNAYVPGEALPGGPEANTCGRVSACQPGEALPGRADAKTRVRGNSGWPVTDDDDGPGGTYCKSGAHVGEPVHVEHQTAECDSNSHHTSQPDQRTPRPSRCLPGRGKQQRSTDQQRRRRRAVAGGKRVVVQAGTQALGGASTLNHQLAHRRQGVCTDHDQHQLCGQVLAHSVQRHRQQREQHEHDGLCSKPGDDGSHFMKRGSGRLQIRVHRNVDRTEHQTVAGVYDQLSDNA